ncbi:MAG: type IV secretion system DNA-binding domain-containing protein [Deltaproteobacteria bacterium]|nr:type IV secretion system DNA-binding domain-containing protein [Deltaproteobacteria bacterium]
MMFGKATLRGGQTLLHDVHMWGQLVRWQIMGLVLVVVIFPAAALYRSTTAYDWRLVGTGTLAELKLSIGYSPRSGQMHEWREGRKTPTPIVDIVADPRIEWLRKRMLATVYAKAWAGAGWGAGGVAVSTLGFWLLGRRLGRTRRVRGAELATARQLRRRVQPLSERLATAVVPAARRASCRIAGIPWPRRAETQHTIVSGTTGSGKTVLISDLVAQVRARGERCIVYDKMGTYTRSFFDPARDVLMNPLDARAPRWSPFYEARTSRDFDMMAAALIPQQKDTVDPFWVTAARQLFSNGAGVLWTQGVTENRRLVEDLLKTELSELAEAMEGTVAQSIVSPDNPKTALSVRAMLTAHLGALEFLPDTGEPFSIRDWVGREDEKGFLFLTSRGDQHASLRGLISTWLEIAVNALLSLQQDGGRRIWIVLDELPTLHQVPSLQPGLAESRQFGGCFVLGIQVFSALRDIYGKNGAETISGLCGTRVVLSAPDQETAQWSAESLGRGEVEEYTHGMSYGASTMRDGVSLTQHRQMRPLALPSEIMRLENLHGYLKFPGPYPVTSIQLKHVDRPASAERFVPRKADGTPPGADAPPVEGVGGKGVQDDGGARLVDEPVDGGGQADPKDELKSGTPPESGTEPASPEAEGRMEDAGARSQENPPPEPAAAIGGNTRAESGSRRGVVI